MLSIFFNDEKVGYEEYIWEEAGTGCRLSVQGRMEKPIPITIERVEIRLDPSYIPQSYVFEGTISGVRQEIRGEFHDGKGTIRIRAAGQDQEYPVDIRRDAFLLPNPLFSPYAVITKKFACSVAETLELSAYIIPQLEVPFLLETSQETPCILLMTLSATQIEIETDEKGDLISLSIPSQGLRVTRDRYP